MANLYKALNGEIEKEKLNLKRAEELNDIEGVNTAKRKIKNLEKGLEMHCINMWD